MNALPPWFPAPGEEGASPAGDDKIGLRWFALVEAGALVAVMGGVEAELAEERDLPALIRSVQGWRRERAEQGVADLVAIMEPGIAALLSIKTRGADPRPAAQALWREFAAARGAVLALLPG